MRLVFLVKFLLGAALLSVWPLCVTAENTAVSVRVDPERTTPGKIVVIDGFSPLDGNGPVRLQIRHPDGKVSALNVDLDSNGDYTTTFSLTQTAGEYLIDAVSPGNTLKGSGKFSVEIFEPLDEEIEQVKKELKQQQELFLDIINDITQQLDKLPDSPARDQVKDNWQRKVPELKEGIRDLGDIDGVFPQRPEVLVEPTRRALEDWRNESEQNRESIKDRLATSRLRSTNCENYDRIIEGCNLASAIANLSGGPTGIIKAVITDVVADLAGKVTGAIGDKIGEFTGAASKFAGTEGVKIGAGMREAHKEAAKELEKITNKAAAKKTLRSNMLGLLFDFSSFVAQQYFSQYCERMAGNFTGVMDAEFRTADDQIWWRYIIDFAGRLELRYAKADSNSDAIAVAGEYIGQATRFRMEEEALREGAPQLMSSAIRFKRTLLPQPVLLNLLTFSPIKSDGTVPNYRPIEVEGKAAATFIKPYSFFVPVQGEIVKGELRLRKGKATHDYSAVARVVYVVYSPLALMYGILPIAFELPFKEGDFFLTRAMGDSGLTLKVKKDSKKLYVDEKVEHEKGPIDASAKYTLKLKLCNPEDKCD